MKILVLNGSPRKKGSVAAVLRAVVEGVGERHQVERIDLYDLSIRPCLACMQCRPDGECCLSEDDAHRVGRRIKEADGLIVGTPTHWGNMSAQLKVLFDRIVPVFIGERPNGIPFPRQQGKSAVIVTACTTPWPFNCLFAQSSGAIWAVKTVLDYGGYKILGKVVMAGSKRSPEISPRLLARARSVGKKF